MFGPRFANLLSIMNIMVLVFYHSILAMLFKRVNLYGEASAVCKVQYEAVYNSDSSQELKLYNEDQFFGDVYELMTVEAFLFFCQVMTLPFWMLRVRCGQSCKKDSSGTLVLPFNDDDMDY
jgi:hypothetical protein